MASNYSNTEPTEGSGGQNGDRTHVHSPVLHYVMTSTAYMLVCVGTIAILIAILVALLYFYFTRVKDKYKLSTETYHYSAVSSSDHCQTEDEDQGSVKRRKLPAFKPQGQGYGAAHHYTPAKSAGQWSTVPVSPHIDVSAGHLLLTYIEENLQNRNKLDQEWEGLNSSAPEKSSTAAASLPVNREKNRYRDALPYDHSRVKLSPEGSASDYINASFIVDTDPVHPKYIAAQGPLKETIVDFWQMVWEQSIGVIVMLTTLTDMGLLQCYQYWPSGGVATYSKFQVRLVSEHPHSEDYIIRSFVVRNTKAEESRTVTQFQYLTWPSLAVPSSAIPLLEFRRKVNKAHTRQDTPLLVHCSGGVGRTGTYLLIDMALSRVQSGAKEINLAATVEHLQDHRPHIVKTKEQFEFALSALVEETHAMLDAATASQRARR